MIAATEARRRLRVVVVDDEPLARRALRQLLDPRDDVEVVAECASAVDVDAALATVGQADLLLVDIEMPVRSGLDLARALAGGPPFVVFVTAYDEYALPAFDTGAVDYLTKPVTPARLERALARVHARVAAVTALAAASAVEPPASLVARIGARDVVIPLAAVNVLEADGVYAAVHVGDRRHLVRRSLDDLERVLAPAHFLRVHRSYLVRRSAVVEARLRADGRRELVLAGGIAVPVSRRRQAAVARWLCA